MLFLLIVSVICFKNEDTPLFSNIGEFIWKFITPYIVFLVYFMHNFNATKDTQH